MQQPYYPPSSPFAGARPNTRPEPLQRPPSARLEQVQAYSPDVYSIPQPAMQPTPAYPSPVQPAKMWSPAPRGEPTTPIARPASGLSSHQALELQVSVPRVFKTYLQWKEEARATTADHQINGFPSPVAWVYVEGHAIPPNAIIGGVDRRGPWHIARAFYEGSMELGKAARHLRLGASVNYHGREHDVDAYEVLVEVNLPTRWVYQPISRPAPITPAPRPETRPLVSLADFKLVVIIDDSSSMDGGLWLEARDALAGVANMSRLKGGEGLDIYCLNSPEFRLGLQNEADVHRFFDGIVPEGQTPTGARLRQILDIYVPRIENTSIPHKPISLLVITDGVPTDDPRPVIIEYARRLDMRNVPLRQFGIQFIQIGDDEEATMALRELDDDLGPTHGIRDMVDATVFSPNQPRFHTDVILRVVLGDNHPDLQNRTTVTQTLIQY
ncbi:hypothetical protein BJV78DRAFT_1282104 [Lactifluus subvellereus]|nr:hypothetical protein BJV78DRAFT_1282104 [Lactifluus subvellereus]